METKDKKETIAAIKIKRNTRASGVALTAGKVYRVGEGDGKVSPKDARYLCQIKKAVSCDRDEKDDKR